MPDINIHIHLPDGAPVDDTAYKVNLREPLKPNHKMPEGGYGYTVQILDTLAAMNAAKDDPFTIMEYDCKECGKPVKVRQDAQALLKVSVVCGKCAGAGVVL